MGLSSILALLHDAFMIVAVFSLFRLEVDITFIAAVLTIVGYSINDTIVTFDRVRENLHKIKVITKTSQIG
ncbi:bifunctional preprotein translocase subunit SecD/SecF [Staphylococcus gallinarum]|uniref:Bifunctional preprotein translocase subunit SecD/SecF n=1 Tax=Staphylococcus gallinarum TaxID=1293 RepID=A0A380FJ81_STAGA|nr:bifunctional preprotein translocase subunit SecD/SecF [Staphylococcus gallinarum]